MSQSPEYDILDSFVLREPLFPVNIFIDLILSYDQVEDDSLKKLLQESIVRESLFIASPSFWKQIEKWEKGQITKPKDYKKIRLSILKYLARLCTKATPFGLFAGCALERFDTIKKSNQLNRKTDLDSGLLGNIIQTINNSYNDFPNIRFYSNNTVVEFNQKYRYLKSIEGNKKNSFVIEEISKTTALTEILKEARYGLTILELSAVIIDKEISSVEAKEFIDLLIKAKLLLSELQISLTSEKHLYQITSLLKETKGILFREITESLAQLDKKNINEIKDYNKIINSLIKFDYKINSNKVFHITSYNVKGNLLDNTHKKKFLNVLKIQRLISSGHKNINLENFKTQFEKKFRSKKVKILKALDPDYGIDYLTINDFSGIAAIFKGLDLAQSKEKSGINLTPLEIKISRIIAKGINKNIDQIVLNDADFDDLNHTHPKVFKNGSISLFTCV